MTMIWLPKKELIVEIPMGRPRMRGYFKLEAIRPDGRVRPLTGWFPNLITNMGLNIIGSASYLNACHVGTDNTAPNVLDTGLAGFVAGTTTKQAQSVGAQSTEPYYGWRRTTFRFATGAAAGNIAEVAVATSALAVGSFNFSRALVLDETESPTTVTVLADEVLDVTYECRIYPPLVDGTGTITITGSGDHDYTIRASSVTSSIYWGNYLGTIASMSHRSLPVRVYNGAIGSITSSPSGTSDGGSPSNYAYVDTSLQKDAIVAFGLNSANLDGGIRSVSYETTLGRYQYELDPVVAKDDTKTLSLVHRFSWGRYTP